MGTIYGFAECRRNSRNSIRKCGKRQESKDNNCKVKHWSDKTMFIIEVAGDYNDFNHCDFYCYAVCLCSDEYELEVLNDGHKLFLPCRVKLATVCHMYRFCVNIRKGRQERFYCCWCEVEVRQSYNLCRKFRTVSIFIRLDGETQFI